jgi:hypothetical protein
MMLAKRTSSLGDRRGVCTPDLLQSNTGNSLDEAANLCRVRSPHQYKAGSSRDEMITIQASLINCLQFVSTTQHKPNTQDIKQDEDFSFNR